MRSRVWDLPTRVFHWGLVASVAAAMLSGDEPGHGTLHVAVGGVGGALLAFRAGWGLVGERWSRFAALGEEPGHDRLAAASMGTAIALLLGIAGTGVVVLGGEELRGPLAGVVSPETGVAVHAVHRVLAWTLVAWVGVHLAGVARKSWLTRENLVRGMIDGRKRHSGADVAPRGPAAVGLALGVAAVGLIGAVTPRESVGPALARSDAWDEACGECHLAFHPSLLPAASWREMLAAEDHFGEFLGLDPATTAELGAFAEANAADHGRTETAVRMVAEGFAGQRVTESRTWGDIHAELPAAVFEREEVGGEVRCVACHDDAEAGTFDGRAADVPEAGSVRLVGRVP